ncbi:MAG: hypothetical protein ACLUDU_05400 [Butyricimonas faecihominis]
MGSLKAFRIAALSILDRWLLMTSFTSVWGYVTFINLSVTVKYPRMFFMENGRVVIEFFLTSSEESMFDIFYSCCI